MISVGRGYNMPSDGVPPDGNEARDYASFYLPYARMARLAYVDEQYGDPYNLCPKLEKLSDGALAEDSIQRNKHLLLHEHLSWLQRKDVGWRCVRGWFGSAPYGRDEEPAPGLATYLWQNGCNVVVAFRGSDFREFADWQANLRAFLPFMASKDQYDHVQNSIEHVISYARRKDCTSLNIAMAGHSLGGGLAQAAAYSFVGTQYVFAFDSSPVTSLLDHGAISAGKSTKYLAIDRVYEVGEILQAVRFVIHGFAQPRVCYPRVRLVRFNGAAGFSPIDQHGLEVLIESLKRLSRDKPATAAMIRRASGQQKAVMCDFRDEVFRDNSFAYPMAPRRP